MNGEVQANILDYDNGELGYIRYRIRVTFFKSMFRISLRITEDFFA